MVMTTPPDINNMVYFKAFLLGLKKCSRWGFKNIVIEGDSSIAINTIKIMNSPNWRLQLLLEIFLKDLSKFDNFISKHV